MSKMMSGAIKLMAVGAILLVFSTIYLLADRMMVKNIETPVVVKVKD
ncbi:MAG: hypothetical protein ACM3JQ_02615 [Candidatus Eiseniibacteriota bacterium]